MVGSRFEAGRRIGSSGDLRWLEDAAFAADLEEEMPRTPRDRYKYPPIDSCREVIDQRWRDSDGSESRYF